MKCTFADLQDIYRRALFVAKQGNAPIHHVTILQKSVDWVGIQACPRCGQKMQEIRPGAYATICSHFQDVIFYQDEAALAHG